MSEIINLAFGGPSCKLVSKLYQHLLLHDPEQLDINRFASSHHLNSMYGLFIDHSTVFGSATVLSSSSLDETPSSTLPSVTSPTRDSLDVLLWHHSFILRSLLPLELLWVIFFILSWSVIRP
ncbi:hypothetical protein GEMRC1_004694 [Eukaryota sp. GEM-RC1]